MNQTLFFGAMGTLVATAAAQSSVSHDILLRTPTTVQAQVGNVVNSNAWPAGTQLTGLENIIATDATQAPFFNPLVNASRRVRVQPSDGEFSVIFTDVVSVLPFGTMTRTGSTSPSEVRIRLTMPPGALELTLTTVLVESAAASPVGVSAASASASIDLFDDGTIDLVGTAGRNTSTVSVPAAAAGPRVLDIVFRTSASASGNGTGLASAGIVIRPTGSTVTRILNPGTCAEFGFSAAPNFDGSITLRNRRADPVALIVGFGLRPNPVNLPLLDPRFGPPCALLVRSDAVGALAPDSQLALIRPPAASRPLRAFVQGVAISPLLGITSAGTFQLDFPQ